jgi:ATP-dependent helicase/nuclease subunit A
MTDAQHDLFGTTRELILASAGSGKTFRISSRLITLLAAGTPPAEILAATFTRKAAGEILDRVLVRLAGAALDRAQAAELARHTGDVGAAADVARADPARWLALLEALTHELHRLNISTLDALFVRAAGSFAGELGLPPGWRIATEPEVRRLRSDALQQVLAAHGDTGQLVELVRTLNRGAANRSVHDLLMDRVEQLLLIHDQLDPAAPDPWAALEREEAAGGDGSDVPDAATLRQRLAAIAAEVDALPVPLTNAGRPRSHWANAFRNAAAQARAGDVDALLGLTLCCRILEGAEDYDRAPVDDDVRAVFLRLLTACRALLAPRLAAQAKALGRFTAAFAAVHAALQRDAGAYGFHDITRLLATAGNAGPVPGRADLGYRLDAATRHLLLDEFQDTAPAQWEALQPLAARVLAMPAATAVVVADPKQSIYGWRGADPSLVLRVGDHYALARDALALSWRSSPVVLDAVNRIFDGLPANPALAKTDVGPAAAAAWLDAFQPHRAAKPELAGHVRLVVGPGDAGRGSTRPNLCRRAAELVAGLRRDMPDFGIGVLTRTNRTVARLIHELRRLGIHASEEGGTPLTDSAAVCSVLALLRLADHPADVLARYHMARTPVGEAVGLGATAGDAAAARRVALDLRRRLLRDGFGPTLEALAGRVLSACEPRDARRLQQLVELAFRFDAGRPGLRPGDFVRLVEAERIADPAEGDVRVMTVHQAKGLEFDVVVLPELDEPLTGRELGRVAYPFRVEPGGRITAVYPPAAQEHRRLFPAIEAAARQAGTAALRDGLSTLYVAATRARHALHMLIRPDADSGPSPSCTAAWLARAALAGVAPVAEGDVLFEDGDPAWHVAERRRRAQATDAGGSAGDVDAAGDVAAPGVAPGSAPVPLRAGPRRRNLPRRSPSGMEGGDEVAVAGLLARGEGTGARLRGTLVHAWFQAIEWLDTGDGVPGDDALRAIARRAVPAISAAEVEGVLADFRGWLAAPALRAALAAAGRPAGTRVLREAPFAYRDGDVVVEGLIDRLVLIPGPDGALARAEVLDFKTDDVPAPGTPLFDARVAHYRPQLDAYRAAVARVYGVAESAVTARLALVRAGVVV